MEIAPSENRPAGNHRAEIVLGKSTPQKSSGKIVSRENRFDRFSFRQINRRENRSGAFHPG